MPIPTILGNDYMRRYRVTFDWDMNRVNIDTQWRPLVDPKETVQCAAIGIQVNGPYNELLREFHDVINTDDVVGVAPNVKMKIITEGPPIRQKAYRLPLTKKIIVEQEIERMLKAGVIRPSSSPWASPIVLIPKLDASTRFCINYKRLNSVTRKDSFPFQIYGKCSTY